MPKFFYVAKNQSGEVKSGDTEAAEERDVVDELKKEGFWVTSIKALEEKKKSKVALADRIFTVPLKSKMVFSRHLGVMLGAGLSLTRALGILANQEENKSFKNIINKLTADVKQGVSLADAMEKFPRVFNKVFVSMIRVGELSGNLEEILNILADQLEKDHKLVSKVRGAMMYPGIIFSVMILMGFLMMIYVIPKITGIFKDFNADLPLPTQILVGVSDFMAAHAVLSLGGLFGTVIGVRLFSKTPVGIRIFHKFFLKAPVIGPVITKVNSARFARILSALLKSGVALVEALRITSDTLGNYYFKQACLKASGDVQKGITLSQVLTSYKNVFPYLVTQMIEVGEETGRTDQILNNLAIFYEEEVDQVTKNLSSVIEPVLMLVIGAAVGFFAIAVIQPIYSLMDKM